MNDVNMVGIRPNGFRAKKSWKSQYPALLLSLGDKSKSINDINMGGIPHNGFEAQNSWKRQYPALLISPGDIGKSMNHINIGVSLSKDLGPRILGKDYIKYDTG